MTDAASAAVQLRPLARRAPGSWETACGRFRIGRSAKGGWQVSSRGLAPISVAVSRQLLHVTFDTQDEAIRTVAAMLAALGDEPAAVKDVRLVRADDNARLVAGTHIKIVRASQIVTYSPMTFREAWTFASDDPQTARWLNRTGLSRRTAPTLRVAKRWLAEKLDFHKSKPPGLEDW